MSNYFTRNGYDVYISMNGAQIPRNRITGEISVNKAEDRATVASFTLRNKSGTQEPELLLNAPVIINVRTSTGLHRMFTGVIETPELDYVGGVTTYTCTDNRDNIFKNLSRSFVESIGYYSTEIFGKVPTQNIEIRKRLTTVPASLDIDNFGNARLTNWAPKSSPDHTFAADTVYRQRPEVTYTSRIKTVNTVNISLDYNYQRLHQKMLQYTWAGPSSLTLWYAEGRPSFPRKDMIRSAAEGTGWQVVGDIDYTDLWPAQGFIGPDGPIVWQPNQVDQTFVDRTDSDGNTVSDINGNPIQDRATVTITDTSSFLCRGATWKSRLRFGQNVTERYNISVKASQSVAKFGTISEDLDYNVTTEYDNKEWEDSTSDPHTVSNYFIDKDTDREKVFDVFNTAMNVAKTTLLEAHRDVTVNFTVFINPDVDMHHTVSTSKADFNSKGKVSRVIHTIDITTGEATTDISLSLSRINGSTSSTALTLPTPPTEDASYIGDVESISLQRHYGVDPASSKAAEWNGHIGNKWVNKAGFFTEIRTQYPEVFIVDTPRIADNVRQTRTLSTSSNYNVEIPNDTLTIGTLYGV